VVSRLNPYISFDGTARQAMEFYKSVFGGTLNMNTFGEYGDADAPGADKIMHAQLETDSGYTLMGADTPNSMEYSAGSSHSISLSGGSEDEEELRGYYEKLAGSGQAIMPLDKAPWGDTFGMCVDGYGVSWLVNIAGQPG
jgi:PhnB protein